MVEIVLSSGHGLYIRGAADIVDEVDEARKIVHTVASYLRSFGVEVVTYNDDVSTSQDENLNRIVDFHNSQPPHAIDCSIHLNAYTHTEKPMGCEVLYISQEQLAKEISSAMAVAGDLVNRGAKFRDDLFFLNQTTAKSVLIETIFCDSQADVDAYHKHYEELCVAIASTIAAALDLDEEGQGQPDVRPPHVAPPEALFQARGPCSWFGGPADEGVDSDEGLAFLYELDDAPNLFLPKQPPGTTGLARRLDPARPYLACRWDYDVTSKDMLRDRRNKALVKATKTGTMALAWPADWGPHSDTGRIADLSPALLNVLGITTDDEVEVIYPAPIEIVF